MDAYDVTKMVYSRVQAFEPDHASKIMGFLLLRHDGEQEMLKLAFSHDSVLHALVLRAKKELGLSSPQLPRSPNHLVPSAEHFSSRSSAQQHSLHLPASVSDHLNGSFLHPQDCHRPDLSRNSSHRFDKTGVLSEQLHFQDRYAEEFLRGNVDIQKLSDCLSLRHESSSQKPQFLAGEFLQPTDGAGGFDINGKLDGDGYLQRFNARHYLAGCDSPLYLDNVTPSTWRPCLYYARGFCKHGSSCKFLHSQMWLDPGYAISPRNGAHWDCASCEDGISTSSLERLEMEIQELLRGRKAPISIASLPQLYYERFGKTLQADGYLTESQRHGKAGYSLTKLLAKLKNSVTIIDRPHGQHAVILTEEAVKFTGQRREKDDLNAGSRQIYLTFPADSAFSEEDVSSYFRAYGPVQDVRIPYQQKRMFGFVTFVYAETVKMILVNGNPHYICGARVLVKPYKEKGKHAERKSEREHPRLPPDFRALDSISGPRALLNHDVLRRQLEEQEVILEIERKRLAELQLEKNRMQQILFTSALESALHAASVAPKASPQPVYVDNSSPPLEGLSGYSSAASACEDVHLLPEECRIALKPIQTSVHVEALTGSVQTPHLASNKEDNGPHSDEHNLPDSPFTSPHKPYSPRIDSIIDPDDVPKTVSAGAPPPGFAIPSGLTENLQCRICPA